MMQTGFFPSFMQKYSRQAVVHKHPFQSPQNKAYILIRLHFLNAVAFLQTPMKA